MKESRKDFIKKAHKNACSEWKTNIEKEFPKLFKKDALVVGKWYKLANSGDHITGLDRDHNLIFVEEFNKCNIAKRFNELFEENVHLLYENHLFGHNPSGKKVCYLGCKTTIKGLTLATDKEVEQALIKEAKKRGFKKGVYSKCLWNKITKKLEQGGFHNDRNELWFCGAHIFDNGKWAEII